MPQAIPVPDGPEQQFAATHPLRPFVLTGTATLVAYSAGIGAVAFVTSGHVPDYRLSTWIGAELLFAMAWAAAVLGMVIRRPDAREAVLVWGYASRCIALVSQLLVAWAIWSFFPFCPEAERMTLAAMFMVCSPAQLIAAPENVLVNRLGIVASQGSLAAWFAMDGSRNALAMGGFALAFGAMLLALGRYVPVAVAETVGARLAAEDVRDRLALALEAVAEERDAKTRFIAAASHDLGQPLQAAGLFFEQALHAPDAAHRERAAAGVSKALASAENLISHMLNHLRLEADQVEPQLAILEIGPALSRIASQFEPSARSAGIALSTRSSSARALLDFTLFDRAMGNLIGNSIVHSGATRIVIGTRRQGNSLRIWVIDNGHGIAADEAHRIFEDYYRGSASRAAVKGGFGLGLSSVHRIATLMGGRAGLDDRWRSGAAFYLEFPHPAA